jgi:hypothetical protein
MQQDPRKTISVLVDHIFSPGMVDYLQSPKFTRFSREHDIEDPWKEALWYSTDKPDLYGDAVIKSAFLLTLRHLYSSRRDEFPEILAALLADFSDKYPGPAFVSEVIGNLVLMDYPGKEMDGLFFKTWK